MKKQLSFLIKVAHCMCLSPLSFPDLCVKLNGFAPIVYATDAAAEGAVKVLWQASNEAHDPIKYMAAGITAEGARFVAHLTSDSAQQVFSDHGFQMALK